MKNLSLLTLFIAFGMGLMAQPEETAQQKSMAKQMASYMDMAWDAEPEEGMANLRILMLEDGKPVEGIVSIHGRYSLIMRGKMNHSAAFNPNKHGKYVYEGLEPGTYQVEIKGQYEAQGFQWNDEILIKENSTPLIELSTD